MQDEACAASLYFPAGQSTQVDVASYLPAAQESSQLEAPLVLQVPPTQSVQFDSAELPVVFENLPSAQ